MRPSSASAPTWPACSPSTASSPSRCSAWSSAGLAATVLGFVTSFLVLRGSDLTRLMVTLGVALVLARDRQPARLAHRRRRRPAGRHDGAGARHVPLRHRSATSPTSTASPCCSCCSCSRAASCNSPFGLSLRAVKGNPLRASAIGISVNCAAGRDLHDRRAAMRAIAGALLTQTTQFASLDVLAFDRSADVLLVLIIGGTGYLYGGLIGAVLFKLMQDWLANLTPQYWQFWIGLVLVVIVLVGRERLAHAAQCRSACCSSAMMPGRSAAPAAVRGRAVTMAAVLRDHRPGEALRRHRRDQRRVADGREGRAPCADRPERRRQDHDHQPADRRAAADRRAHPARGRRHHRSRSRTRACGSASPARSRSTSCSPT